MIPGASLRLPARTQLLRATLGMSCTGQTMIFKPFASVAERTSSRPGTGGTEGSAAAVSEPTVRKCEPKLLFIARSLTVQPPGKPKRTFLRISRTFVRTQGTCSRRENGYER